MIYEFPNQSKNEVNINSFGQKLDFILWQGNQWCVTEYGIEKRDGTYSIESKRIYEEINGNYFWPMHLSMKDWFEYDDFMNCFDVAKILFNKNGTRTTIKAPNMMDESFAVEYASEIANKAYDLALNKAMNGAV